MAACTAEFFTLDEVNRLKIIQDVVDHRLTTQVVVRSRHARAEYTDYLRRNQLS